MLALELLLALQFSGLTIGIIIALVLAVALWGAVSVQRNCARQGDRGSAIPGRRRRHTPWPAR